MREVKNAAENQAPREITGGKRKNRLLAKSGRRTWRRNRGTGLVSMGRGIKYGKVGAEAERGSGDGQSWLARPKRGKRRQHATARGWAEWGGRVPLTLVLVRLPLALARRGGLTASAIDPATAQSLLVFVKTLRGPQPADFRPPTVTWSNLHHSRRGAATRSLYGPQLRTNHFGRPFHRRIIATPPPFRPHPLTRAQGRLAPPHLRLDCTGWAACSPEWDRVLIAGPSTKLHWVWIPGVLAHLTHVGLKEPGESAC